MDELTAKEAAALVAAQPEFTPAELVRIDAVITASVPTLAMLKWDDEQLASCTYAYYPDADTLYMHEEPRQRTTALHVGEYALLRLRMGTTEVVGAFIEGWERFFLPLHPEFREGWERIIKSNRKASAEERAEYNLALMHCIFDSLRESERAGAKAGA